MPSRAPIDMAAITMASIVVEALMGVQVKTNTHRCADHLVSQTLWQIIRPLGNGLSRNA